MRTNANDKRNSFHFEMKRSFSSARFDAECMADRCRLYFNALRRIGKPTSHMRLRLLQYLEQFFGDVVKQEWDEVREQAIDEFFESYRFTRIHSELRITDVDVLRAVNQLNDNPRRPSPPMTLDEAERAHAGHESDTTTESTSVWHRVSDIPPGFARRTLGAPHRLDFGDETPTIPSPMTSPLTRMQRQADMIAEADSDGSDTEQSMETHRNRNWEDEQEEDIARSYSNN